MLTAVPELRVGLSFCLPQPDGMRACHAPSHARPHQHPHHSLPPTTQPSSPASVQLLPSIFFITTPSSPLSASPPPSLSSHLTCIHIDSITLAHPLLEQVGGSMGSWGDGDQLGGGAVGSVPFFPPSLPSLPHVPSLPSSSLLSLLFHPLPSSSLPLPPFPSLSLLFPPLPSSSLPFNHSSPADIPPCPLLGPSASPSPLPPYLLPQWRT
ncbi:unnamed protein product, partial [Closterium sp. Naga37s-1]